MIRDAAKGGPRDGKIQTEVGAVAIEAQAARVAVLEKRQVERLGDIEGNGVFEPRGRVGRRRLALPAQK